MSEFSDCYYLFDASTQEAISLVRKVRRYGIVLPSVACYTPFLVDGAWDAGRLVDAVVENNVGTLLHYSFAEDHGLWLAVYESSNESFVIDIQRRGQSENDLNTISCEIERLKILSRDRVAELHTILESVATRSDVELRQVRTRLSEVLNIVFLEWTGCADLSVQSQKELSRRFPEAAFVLQSQRGKADKAIEPIPNEWCPQPGLPAFMYLPVPEGQIDQQIFERHVKHWIETQDWDDDRQAGFWLYTAYRQTLPNRMRYLADRIMNLELAFGKEKYEAELSRTIRGILAVTSPTFDWEPYLDKIAGEQRL